MYELLLISILTTNLSIDKNTDLCLLTDIQYDELDLGYPALLIGKADNVRVVNGGNNKYYYVDIRMNVNNFFEHPTCFTNAVIRIDYSEIKRINVNGNYSFLVNIDSINKDDNFGKLITIRATSQTVVKNIVNESISEIEQSAKKCESIGFSLPKSYIMLYYPNKDVKISLNKLNDKVKKIKDKIFKENNCNTDPINGE